MRSPASACLLVISSVLVSACGYRGPLYLPEDKERTEVEAAQAAGPGGEGAKVATPQPAPQAQKRDRTSGTLPVQP